MNNAKYESKVIKKTCETKLDIKFKSTKEYNGWFFHDDIKVTRITVPLGKKFIPPKTYKAMASQLKLAVNEFDDLLDCPLNKDKYISLLMEREFIKNKELG
ncbi:MAG: hypothetical protein C4582_09005 [Desulfobacteraceae bacterium]|nr:MAG: hypothetical protein C4582_09005 [Desulfobacteraceae bacterium]